MPNRATGDEPGTLHPKMGVATKAPNPFRKKLRVQLLAVYSSRLILIASFVKHS